MIKNANSILRNPYLRIFLIILFLCLIISGAIFSFNLIYKKIFSENPRFRLKNLIVNSSGYWNNRSNEVCQILDLKIGSSNLFTINLSELREKLESKKGEGIDFAEISKELPDTLIIKIIERMPQAILYNKKSGMIVDKDGVVIDSKYFMNVIDSLPVITGFRIDESSKGKTNYFGEKLNIIKPALIFLSVVSLDYNDLEVRTINLYSPNTLIVFMKCPNNKVIKVILPFQFSIDPLSTNLELAESSKLIKSKLDELRELLKYLDWKKSQFTEINMLYKEQAIVK